MLCPSRCRSSQRRGTGRRHHPFESSRTDPVRRPRSATSIGDAAVAHDPVSSYGLSWSLRSSIDAALTVTSDLNGDDDAALGKYEKKIKVEFSYFIDRLKDMYRRENRFPQSKYWNRF